MSGGRFIGVGIVSDEWGSFLMSGDHFNELESFLMSKDFC